MKAAVLHERPSFELMKLTDVLSFYHLQMPRWLFADSRYKTMELETKVAYTFLLNRFQLSRLNGWVNDDGEVFVVFTREELAREMQVSYRKAIECFQQLAEYKLIWERRLGRGKANQIYLAAVRLGEKDAAEYDAAPFAAPRPAKTACLESAEICENGTSGSAQTAHQDMPKPHTSHIEKIQNEETGLSDGADELDGILRQCELHLFSQTTGGLFGHAVTRLYYADCWKIDQSVLPRAVIRRTLRDLNGSILQSVEQKMQKNTERTIRNTMAYTMTMILNEIWESEAALLLDPDLNSFALPERRAGP